MVGIVTGNELGLSTSSLAKLGEQGTVGKASYGRNGESVHVNAATGNLVLQQRDEILLGRGPDADLVRTYNSQGVLSDDPDAPDNWLPGWSKQLFDLTGTLNTADSTIARRDAQGALVRYSYVAGVSAYVSTLGEGAWDLLTYQASTDTWTWTEGSTRIKENYGACASGRWRITARADVDNNTVRYSYDAQGRLNALSTAAGERLELDYQESRLTQVRSIGVGGAQSTRTRYAYDSAGRLSEVSVDLNPEDNSIADGAVYRTRYTYEGASTRVASLWQSDGSTLAFGYTQGSDGLYRITQIVEDVGGLNRTTTVSYDLGARLTRITDPGGARTELRFDVAGHLLSVQGESVEGTVRRTGYTWDSRDNLVGVTDALGRLTTYAYSRSGVRVLERDALGNTLVRQINSANQVVIETRYITPDPDGAGPKGAGAPQCTRYVYDGNTGVHLRFVLSPEGEVREMRYDTQGQVLRELTYLGARYELSTLATGAVPGEASLKTWAVAQDQGQIQLTEYAYDLRGALAAQTRYARVDAAGMGIADGTESTTRFVYGTRGELLHRIDPRTPAPTTLWSQDFSSNAVGLSPLPSSYAVVQYGRLDTWSKAISGRDTPFSITGTRTQALGTVFRAEITTAAASPTRYLRYGADNANTGGVLRRHLAWFSGAGLYATWQEGSEQSLYLGAAKDNTTYVVEVATDARGSTLYVYEKGAPRSSGFAHRRECTDWGVARSAIDLRASPGVSATSLVSLDNLSERSGLELEPALRAAGSLPETQPAGVTSYLYDGLGREIARVDNLGTRTLTRYDDAERRTLTTIANGLVHTRLEDASGALLSQTQSQADTLLGTTRYRYDAGGRLRITEDASGVRRHLLYDAAGRKVGEIDGEGVLTETTYDANDQPVCVIRYATRLSDAAWSSLADAQGNPAPVQLAAIRPDDSTLDRRTWTLYDAAGRVAKTIDPLGAVTEQRYDGASQVMQITAYATRVNPTQISANTLATDARVSPAPSTADRTTRYLYDPQGRLRATLDAEGYLTEQRYDAAGQLTQRLRTASAVPETLRASGSLAELVQAVSANANPDDQVSFFIHDGKGQRVGEIDALGYLTETVFDAAGNVIETIRYANAIPGEMRARTPLSLDGIRPNASSDDRHTRATYDLLDRKTGEILPDATRIEHVYDAQGRLIRSTQAAASADARSTLYRYDTQGRLIAEISPLASATLATLTDAQAIETFWQTHATRHVYDAAGRRVASLNPLGQRTLYYHDREGRLVHSVNALGEVSTLRYDAQGQRIQSLGYLGRLGSQDLAALGGGLTSASVETLIGALSAGSTQDLDYDAAGQVVGDTDALGNTRRFTYNTFGDLVRSETPLDGTRNQIRTRSYDRRGALLSEITDPDGLKASITYSYDAFGRRVSETNARGITAGFAYDRLGRVVELRDGLDQRTRSTYDAFDQVLSVTDALGHTTTYRYDLTQRQVTVISAEGVRNTSTRNAHGELVSQRDGLGGDTQRTYDADGRIVAVRAADGSSTRNLYDALGQLIQSIDARGTRTSFAYDEAGRLIERVVDPREASNPSGLHLRTQYRYDAQGRAVWTQDASGIWTRTEFDAQGQVRAIERDPRRGPDALEGAPEDNPQGLGLRTETTYDAQGHVLILVGAAGTSAARTTTYAYDLLGRRVEEHVDPAGLNLTTRYAYDARGNLVRRTDAAGNATRYAYDANDRLIFTVDALGQVSQRSFDALGHLVEERTYARAITLDTELPGVAQIEAALRPNPTLDRITRQVRDADGRLRYRIDAAGAVTAYSLDGNGNVVRETRYANAVSLSGPVNLSDLEVALLPSSTADRSTLHVYDAANRERYSLDPLGHVSAFTYDAAGNLTLQIRYASPISVQGEQDAQAIAAALAPDATQDRALRHVYDAANRRVASLDALGYLTSTVYDALGHVLTETRHANALSGRLSEGAAPRLITQGTPGEGEVLADPARDACTRYGYDGAGRLILTARRIDATTEAVQTRTLDALGKVRVATDALGNTTHYAFDAAGREVLRVDALGFITTQSYDAIGTPVRSVRYANATAGSWSAARLPVIVTVAPDASATGTPYVLADAARDQVSTFTYDALGQRIRATDAENQTESTTWNAFGEKASFTNKAGGTFTYTYDVRGNLLEETLPVSAPDAQGTPRPVLNRSTWNAFGEKLTQTDAASLPEARTTTFSYDALGRLSEKRLPAVRVYDPVANRYTDNVQPIERWLYDAFDNVTRYVDANGNTTATYYDALNRKRAEVNAAGFLSTYTLDAAGKVITRRSYANAVQAGAGAKPSPAIAPEVLSQAPPDTSGRVYVLSDTARDRATSFTYDALNRQTGTRIEQVTVGAYDAATAQYRISTTDLLTATAYDAAGNIVRTIDANGNVTRHYYDRAGRKVASVDAARYLTTWARDGAGEIMRESRYANALVGSLDLDDTTTLAHLTSDTALTPSAQDRVTEFVYDRLARKVRETLRNVQGGSVDATTGQLIESTQDATTVYQYNGLSQVTRVINALKAVIDTDYDLLGRKTREQSAVFLDAAGNLTRLITDTEYNGLGLITRVIKRGQNNDDRISTTAYDAAGRATMEVDANGQQTRLDRDAQGNITQKTLLAIRDAQNNLSDEATRYRYDALNRQTHTHDAGTGVIVESGYNGFGEVTAKRTYVGEAPARWDEVTEYDRAGRAWKSNAGDGITKVYVFDGNGNATLKIDNPAVDLSTGALVDILKLDGNNPYYSVYDSRNLLIATHEPSVVGQGQRMTLRAEQDGQWVFVGNSANAQITAPDSSTNRVVREIPSFGGVATLAGHFALQSISSAMTESGIAMSWAPMTYTVYGYWTRLTITPPRTSNALPGERYRVVVSYVPPRTATATEFTSEFNTTLTQLELPAFGVAVSTVIKLRLFKVSALGALHLGDAWMQPGGGANLSITANQVIGSASAVSESTGTIWQPSSRVIAHDLSLSVNVPHLFSAVPGEKYRVVVTSMAAGRYLRWTRSFDYDATLTRLAIPTLRVGLGETATLTLLKLTAAGQQSLGTVSLPTESGFVAPLTPNRVLYIHNQPVDTRQVLLAYRPSGSSLWQWLTVHPTLNSTGAALAGWAEVDLTGFNPGAYEFQYFGITGAGGLSSWESGGFNVGADNALGNSLSAAQNSPSTQNALGNALFSADGNLHILATGAADTLSLRYRRQGSTEDWSVLTLANAAPAGIRTAGWFTLAHLSLFQSATPYEFDLTTYRGDTLLRRASATYTRDARGSATLSEFLAPMEVMFGQRTDTESVLLGVRAAGTEAPYTPIRLSPTAPGSGRFVWDATAMLPDRTRDTDIEVLIQAYSADGLLNHQSRATLRLGPNAALLSSTTDTLAPVLRLSPSQRGVTALRLSYRAQNSSDAYTPLDAIAWGDEFRADVSGVRAPATGTIVYEYLYDALDAAGNVLGRTEGTFVLGATSASANRLDWVIQDLGSRTTRIQHTQRHNAFGEVVSQTDGLGRLTESRYNTQGRLIEQRSPETDVTLTNGFVQRLRPTTRTVHDLLGRAIGTVDANGNLRTQVWRSGDTTDDIVLERAADGALTRHRYDTFGDKRFSLNALWSGAGSEAGYLTEYRYDALGHVIEMRLPERLHNTPGNDTGSAQRAIERYTYDGAGRRVTHTNALGFTDTTAYDTLGRIIRTTSAQGFVTSYRYDYRTDLTGVGGKTVSGWQKRTTDAAGRSLIDRLDAQGRATWHQDLGGHTFSYQYNHAGWLTAQLGSTGQRIAREYYANGMLKLIWDQATGAYTRYEYDAAGNRTFEGYVTLKNPADPAAGVRDYHQYATLEYDELNRLTRVLDPRADIRYEYDAQGNTRRVWSSYHDGLDGARRTLEYWYLYDAENRFTLTQGTLSGSRATSPTDTSATDTSPRIHTGNTGVALAYNLLGQRVQASNGVDGSRESYRYSAEGYLIEVSIDTNPNDTTPGILRSRRQSDLAGRVIAYTEYDPSGRNPTNSRTSVYDRDNRVLSQSGTEGSLTYRYYTDATDSTASESGAGALARTISVNAGTTVNTYTAYTYWDTPKELALTNQGYNPEAGDRNNSWRPGYARHEYDVNGNLLKAIDAGADGVLGSSDDRTLRYTTDAQGLILNRDESSANRVSRIHRYYYANGNRVGDVSNEGPSRTDYVQAMAQRGGKRDYRNWKPIAGADFDQNYEPVGPTYPGMTPGQYTVCSADTLPGIAAQLWGDRALWYLLAEANGLSGQESLSAGQVLSVPNKLTNVHHNAGTFRVYNATDAIGDVSPTLPDLPPPPAKKGCGALAQILIIVVVVVVSIYTAGAATSLLGSQLAGQVIGAAVGSMVGQALSMAAGLQDSFSWKQVGISALSAGLTQGLPGASALGADPSWSEVALHGVRAMAANALTQEIAVKLGLQEHFQGRSVFAAGASAAVSAKVDDWVGRTQYGEMSWGEVASARVDGYAEGSTLNMVTRSFVSNAAANVVQVEVYDAPFNLAQVAANAIGDTVADGVANAMLDRREQADAVGWNDGPLRYASADNIRSDAAVVDAPNSYSPIEVEGPAVEVTASRLKTDAQRQQRAQQVRGQRDAAQAAMRSVPFTPVRRDDAAMAQHRADNETAQRLNTLAHEARLRQGGIGLQPSLMNQVDGSLSGAARYTTGLIDHAQEALLRRFPTNDTLLYAGGIGMVTAKYGADTVAGAIGLMRLATSSQVRENTWNAISHPLDTVSGAVEAFMAAQGSEKALAMTNLVPLGVGALKVGSAGYALGRGSKAAAGIDPSILTNGTRKSEFLFRGDSRSPETIFETGFEPRGTNQDMYKYLTQNEASIYNPTSKSPTVAREFAEMQGGGYVYTIRGQPHGIDVNATLGSESPFPHEMEVAVPGLIKSSDIMGARQVGRNGRFTGPFIRNPSYLKQE